MTAIEDMYLKAHEAEERAAALERLLLPFLWESRRCSHCGGLPAGLAVERVRLAFDEHPVKPRARSTNVISAAANFDGDRKKYDRVFELEAAKSARERERECKRKAEPPKRRGRPRKGVRLAKRPDFKPPRPDDLVDLEVGGQT